eukprot:SAG11_NODE_1591_length_4618_cov_3.431069_3_plen_103_part_00
MHLHYRHKPRGFFALLCYVALGGGCGCGAGKLFPSSFRRLIDASHHDLPPVDDVFLTDLEHQSFVLRDIAQQQEAETAISASSVLNASTELDPLNHRCVRQD